MISDLDISIKHLLQQYLPKEIVDKISISFSAPDDQFPPASVTLPAINIFLYDIRENQERRRSEVVYFKKVSNTKGVTRRQPIWIECSYIVTAWPAEGSGNPARDEHRLLSEVMKVFLQFHVIPEDVLQGSLQGVEPLPSAFALRPGHLQSPGEFWQALGGKPRASFHYSIILTMDVYAEREVNIATDKQVDIEKTN